MPSSLPASTLFLLSGLVGTAGGFSSSISLCPGPSATLSKRRRGWGGRAPVAFASEGEGDEDKPEAPSPTAPLFGPSGGGGTEVWEGFNPFQKGASFTSASSSSSSPAPGGQMSLRALRMKSITGDLLRNSSNISKMNEVLMSHADFLVEQLVDVESPLDLDSIYDSSMGPTERRGRYAEVMEERIAAAKSGEVRTVLGSLMEFVLIEAEKRSDGSGGSAS